jgi:sulfotransferase
VDKLIFNSSMPRSGSELIQVILSQNPKIYASVTSPLLEYQFAAKSQQALPEVKAQDPAVMERAFLSMCQGMAVRYYSAITDRPIIIDKNRGWCHYYEWISRWHPNPKIICLVRDLRGIISSMEKIYRKNRHKVNGPDLPHKMQNMTLEERVDYWLNSLPVGLATKRTLDLFYRGVAENIHFIRYEDLCNSPETVIKNLYEYIDEDYFEHSFNRIQKTIYEDDSHHGPYGSHYIKETLKPCPKEEWKDVIPDNISEKIIMSNPWYYQTFYNQPFYNE